MAVTINRKNTSAVIHLTANATINVAGNSTTSDIATGNEVLTGATIVQVFCGCPSGANAYWTVKRGANTALVLDSTGYFDYAGAGMAVNIDTGGTIVANLENSADGYLLIEVQKIGTFTSEYNNT